MAHANQMRVKEKGFTLIEMMVVLTIIGILSAIAGYTYYAQIQRMRLNQGLRGVDQALQQAKMTAITTGVAAGVVFFRRGSDDLMGIPDEYYIFSDSTGDNRYTDDDTPCRGCKVNRTDTASSTADDFIRIGCSASDKPSTSDCTRPATYLSANDLIVDGPFSLETGVYFAKILGASDATQAPYSSLTNYEYILFKPMGGVEFPPENAALTTDGRRIYLQNHPNQRSNKSTADQGAIQINFATGISRVVPTGLVQKDAWK